MGLSDKQENAIVTITIVTSAISLVADCFIIFGYLAFKPLKKLAFTFIFCIALADFCRSCAQTWGEVTSPFGCKLQGWLQTFGAVAMGFWFATIAAVCISIKKFTDWWKTKTQHQIKRFQQIVTVAVAVFAFICASIPWGQYAYLGGWCWIETSDQIGHILRYACYYGWLMACLLFTIIVYCELFRMIRQEMNAIEREQEDEVSVSSPSATSNTSQNPAPSTLDTKRRQRRMFDQMKLYPWALIIGQGPGAVRRIIELISGEAPFFFVVLHALCSGLFGFITAVIYGTKTWEIYLNRAKALCPTQHSHDEPVEDNTTTKTVEMNDRNESGNTRTEAEH